MVGGGQYAPPPHCSSPPPHTRVHNTRAHTHTQLHTHTHTRKRAHTHTALTPAPALAAYINITCNSLPTCPHPPAYLPLLRLQTSTCKARPCPPAPTRLPYLPLPTCPHPLASTRKHSLPLPRVHTSTWCAIACPCPPALTRLPHVNPTPLKHMVCPCPACRPQRAVQQPSGHVHSQVLRQLPRGPGTAAGGHAGEPGYAR